MTYTSLSSILFARNVPAGQSIIISDTLHNPGDFLLHHFLAGQLLNGQKVILVGLSHGWTHYLAMAKRRAVNLKEARERGALVYLDLLSKDDLLPRDGPENDHLTRLEKTLLETINASLAGSAPGDALLVVIDDLMALHWLGASVEAVVGLVQGIETYMTDHPDRLSLISLVHTSGSLLLEAPEVWASRYHLTDTVARFSAPLRASLASGDVKIGAQYGMPPFAPQEYSASDEAIVRRLLSSTNLILSVLPLASTHGQGTVARDVHGELRILTDGRSQSAAIRQGRWHYRLLENTVQFFARGAMS